MNTLELKNILIEEYNSEILKAEEDIENGFIISHNDVKSKIDEWKEMK